MTPVAPALFQTRCSYCDTVLDVSAAQLQSDSGLLSCGDCGKIFNAAWNLIDQIQNPTHLARPETRDTKSALPTRTHPQPPNRTPPLTHDPGKEDQTPPSPDSRAPIPDWENLTPGPLGRSEPRLNSGDMPDLSASDLPRRPARLVTETPRWAWPVVGILMACLALAVQIRFSLLHELASVSSTRPVLEVLCRHTGCELPEVLAGPTVMVTRSSVNLHRQLPEALIVRVHLLNRGRSEQDYPALELTLSDPHGRVLGRRTYLPHEFGVADETLGIGGGRATVVTLVLSQPDPLASAFSARVVRS